MKLFRFGIEGQEKPGVIWNNQKIDVSGFVKDYTEEFLTENGLAHLQAWLQNNADSCPIVGDGVRFGSCLARPSKIICVGLNYAQHAKETGVEPPKEPVLFFKSTTALCGPNDNVIIPPGSVKTDWEVELAVIIGKKASYLTLENAMDYVAGYALHNDYSEREYQLERSGQWVKGKSCDSFAPMGPYFVTKDEVPNPGNLHLWLDVNGKRMQDSSTSDLIFDIPYLIYYISQFMTMLPGDIISTGTPQGVGLGQKPTPWYLKAGDVVKLGIEGLGEQQQIAVNKVL
jgi:2-keto-4-pentenoate hydratase/2-oxohepta-3-ene-1,7-dioic acid hydratase in catechol pathway